jgi:hypothetical protein
MFAQETLTWIESLPNSEFRKVLLSMPKDRASTLVETLRQRKPQVYDEKEADRERKAVKRAIGRELFIPVPRNIERRNACLADPQLLLTTYFPVTYYEEFTQDRSDMLLSIKRAAMYGGDQAIAGPRGEGKTTLAIDGGLCLMLAGLSMFPVIIGKNQDAASDELKALRERLTYSQAFVEDFPEIGVPLAAIGPSTANARLQTVGGPGKFIGMFIGQKHFAFPKITKEQLPHWPDGVESVAHGQVLGAVGIEGRIRGFKFRSLRPTLAIIDDIEDKDSARSDEQIEKNEKIIEEDIGGMGSSAERIARVYLCTTLNRKCNAYKYTDRTVKPSWNGRRYRKMIRPPDRMDLVEQYIDMRKSHKDDDPDARVAFRFWRDNQAEIESGCVVSNPNSFNRKLHSDGEPIELSTCHAYYNRVADTSARAVATEIDNDPPEEVGPIGSGLTADIVQSRRSGLARLQLPANCTAITSAIDLGKHYCHWITIAWWRGAGGVVVDYGIVEVVGNKNVRAESKLADMEASEPGIYTALLNWRDELINKVYVDTTGLERRVDFVLVDSGSYTRAAYEFCRQVRGVFHPSKGQVPFHAKTKSTDTIIAGSNIYAAKQVSEQLWLYHLDSSYWKQFVHERFLTPTFDENNMLRKGSLSLFDVPGREHNSYSHHIVAEQLVAEFKEGKGTKTYWDVRNDNNHWLDATYMAAAGAEAMGIKLIGQTVELQAVPKQDKPKPASKQHGFARDPSGWMQRINRNRRR